MIKLKINDTNDFLIEKFKDYFLVNGEKKELDIVKIDDDSFHVIHNNKSFIVRVLERDLQSKSFVLKVNEGLYKVNIKDNNDLLMETLGIQYKTIQKSDVLKAPMPGLIVDIRISEGQKVCSGEPLIVLKAMKMENILKAPHDGLVRKILVEKNQKINKDTVILQF